MNTDMELSQKARAASAFTGREPRELMDEGVPLVSAWAEHETRLEAPLHLFRIQMGADAEDDQARLGELNETPSGSERGITTAGTPEGRLLDNLISWMSVARTLVIKTAPRLRGDVFIRLLDRFHDLLDPDEWEPGEPMPNLSSLNMMLHFLADNTGLATPMVGLLRSGHFELSWLAAPDKLTVLEFRDDGAVDWLVFAPARPGQATKERAEGTCAFELIWERLRGYGVMEWMNGGE